MIKIEKLVWDSNLFGYSIGKAEIEELHIEQYLELLEIISESEMKLVYIYPIDDISKNTLSAFKPSRIDTKVIFEKDSGLIFKTLNNVKSFDNIEQYTSIEKLAFLSGEFSRFKKDKNFSNNEFIKLYTEWIRKSINKEIATDVLIYNVADRISGFVSYEIISPNSIVIGLIAVETEARGKGIGKMLMQAIENIAIQNRINKIIVSTQLDNHPAMALYHSCGYIIKEQKDIYHYWK